LNNIDFITEDLIEEFAKIAHRSQSGLDFLSLSREEQTFILSYAYNYDSYENESEFINKLNEIGLLFHKEKCLYQTLDAYKIIIYENMCPIDVILQQI
jgi:hypothetical protein